MKLWMHLLLCSILNINVQLIYICLTYIYIAYGINREYFFIANISLYASHFMYGTPRGPRKAEIRWFIMTSSNGNIFRVTGPLCGEFTGDRWIPITKAIDAELWCFLWYLNAWVNNHEADDVRRHRIHYDVIVMLCWVVCIVCPVQPQPLDVPT